jgi:hypothetical protein
LCRRLSGPGRRLDRHAWRDGGWAAGRHQQHDRAGQFAPGNKVSRVGAARE